jgi:hypothetical protein
MAAATILLSFYIMVAAAMVWRIACGRQRSETLFPAWLRNEMSSQLQSVAQVIQSDLLTRKILKIR